jgi:pimeloyl-ACP methyl ester carboxylesterase
MNSEVTNMAATTTTYTKATLDVPGATLYYEVRGSGPVLLMMPGGPADATTFRQIENDLAKRFTVVTYDPRTYSHSLLKEPVEDSQMVQVFADDAHRLLKKVAGDEKSCVFASSGGATIALELIARHPEQLDTVVCHEPPSPSLLPNKAEARAGFDDVCDTCEKEGLFPAMQKFMVLVGVQGGPPQPDHEPTAEEKEHQALMMGNMNYFFGRYIRNIGRYEPDLDAIAKAPCRVIGAVGEESDENTQLACAGGKRLALIAGGEPVVFPGDHGGFDGKPKEFAARLLEVLG